MKLPKIPKGLARRLRKLEAREKKLALIRARKQAIATMRKRVETLARKTA